MLELQVPGILLRSVKLPNSPIINTSFLGFYFGSWDAPGAPGVSFGVKGRISAKKNSPGLLTDASRMVILQEEAPKLPEILEISSGSRLGGCSWDDQAAGTRIRKE